MNLNDLVDGAHQVSICRIPTLSIWSQLNTFDLCVREPGALACRNVLHKYVFALQ